MRLDKGKVYFEHGCWETEVPLFYLEGMLRAVEGKPQIGTVRVKIDNKRNTISFWQEIDLKVVMENWCATPSKYMVDLGIIDLPTKAELKQAISYLILYGNQIEVRGIRSYTSAFRVWIN